MLVLIQFSFSRAECLSKANNYSLSYYFHIPLGRQMNEWLFEWYKRWVKHKEPRLLIWTRVSDFISYDKSSNAKHASFVIRFVIYVLKHCNTMSMKMSLWNVSIILNGCVPWSTTDRREIRNFFYPSVFKLTGHQRLTVKKRNRNVGQFLAADVTNPGQDGSQQMFALCERDSSPNELPDRRKRLNDWPESESGSSPLLSSAEIGIRKSVLGQQLGWQDMWTLWPRLWVKKRKESWTSGTYAFKPKLYIKPRLPVKEKILSEGTRQQTKYCNYLLSLSLSLSQFEEGRKKRIRTKDICIWILSVDNIADTLNMYARMY